MKKTSDRLIEFVDKEKKEINRNLHFVIVFKIQNNHLVSVIKNTTFYVRKSNIKRPN